MAGVPPIDDRGLMPGQVLRPGVDVSPREWAEVSKRLGPRALLLDCRTIPEWNMARVEGSLHVPLDEIEGRAADLGLDEAQEVGVICHHGVRSLKAALMLRHLGFANVRSVAGGIELWSLAVDAGVPRYERSGGVCKLVP